MSDQIQSKHNIFGIVAVLLFLGAGCAPVGSPQTNTGAGVMAKNMVVGVMMKGGQPMVIMKSGETKLLDQETMIDGAKVMMDGTIIKPDGTSSKIEEGKNIMLGDKMMTGNRPAAVAPVNHGFYEEYAPTKLPLAQTGKVVLYFHAPWCPTCQAIDRDINANLSAIPTGTAILKVDYDSSTPQKQKYGVTYQHTFVQVDANGNLIKKWSGSPTLATLLAQVQ